MVKRKATDASQFLISRTIDWPSTCCGDVVSRRMLSGGLSSLEGRTTHWLSKDISCHSAHSRGFYQSVCVDPMHSHVPVCHFSIWIGWMVRGLCIGVSLVLAGRQIMRQQLHCWHQISIKDKGSQQIPLPPLCNIPHCFTCMDRKTWASLQWNNWISQYSYTVHVVKITCEPEELICIIVTFHFYIFSNNLCLVIVTTYIHKYDFLYCQPAIQNLGKMLKNVFVNKG